MAKRLYGIVWRWHFLAGLIACPAIAVIALSGALYTFQPELERWLDGDLITVTPGPRRASASELIAVATRTCAPGGMTLPGPRDRAVVVDCAAGGREIFLDPYRETVLGTRTERSLLGDLLAIHWELLLGDTGRRIVEWATSWAVVVLISGAILWWPRGRRTGGGVWWPRWRLGGRQRLRDLHAIAGAYALPVALVLAATGLMWTPGAGDRRWQPVATDAVSARFAHPPVSVVTPGRDRIGVDAALVATRLDLATESRTIYAALPDAPDAVYTFYVYDASNQAPSRHETIWIDAYDGSERGRATWADRSALGKIDAARYAIHVGALLGWPGRIAACVAALVLAALCLTGPWMWWKRRPRGSLGAPPAAPAPWPLYAALAALGALLPMVGWTLLVVGGLELIVWLIRRRSGAVPM